MRKGFLVFTLFERFSYYLFLSVIAFYLSNVLELSLDNTGDYYSGFMWIVFISPIAFGFLADKFGYIRFFHFGVIFSIIGYALLPFELFDSKHLNIIIPLLILSLGAGSLRLIVPVMIGTSSSKGKYKRGYIVFVWYLFFISLGSVLAKAVTNDVNLSDLGEASISILVLSGFFLIIGYIIWFLINRFGKRLEKDELTSDDKKGPEKIQLLINILIISLPLFLVIYGLSYYLSTQINAEPGFLPNKWTSYADLILMFLFGIILIRTRPLVDFQLVRLVKLGVSILGIVVMICFIVSLIFQNGLNNFSSTIIFIVFEIATTFIGPILMYLVFKLTVKKHKGLIMGLYLSVIAIAIIFNNLIALIINESKILGFISPLIIIGGVLIYLRDKKIKNIA